MDDELLKIICCPVCQGDLKKVSDVQLKCLECEKEYQIKDDIPILLVD